MIRVVGHSGCSWSSSVTNNMPHRLGFSLEELTPNGNGGHAYGFQLRCLQE
ncbi:MAG: hypothetical protein K2G93_08490 [Rikenella sp.]|nr:hypothetical protein [Rikenella sp.]